ncbi:MAG: hypothetical protein ACLFVQ_08300 [Chitinispirillaceae bacterium]
MKVLLWFTLCVGLTVCGCALSGTVVDKSEHRAELKKVKLQKYPALKVYCGGVRRELPLKVVKTCSIDPSVTTAVDGELYLGAQIELSDGSSLGASDKGTCFISADNGLVGRSDHGRYSVTFENVSSFTIGK